ncbi:SAM-dependent methyltransferase [Saccharothrix tamanrassetensis]|uniref:SAM-dependent methyltransferase n=1 Tax=Saccharothrix tamanrassetensis TaxID=1051531 RepID=A0A841CL02_9PSEU|nr:SAM-dependent methyltransferase [Saccharothrix tamanrassetensis]
MTSDDLSARRANSFGPHAHTYAEHRPDYPAAAVRWALAPLGPGHHRVLDLGAGTGKLTGVLVAEGHQVTAVEPDESMLSELVRRHGGVRALPGTAERIPVPDGTVDAVVVGQAFHWFDPTRSMPEIARVLRPGGVLAGLWNNIDATVPWAAEFDRIIQSSASTPSTPTYAMPDHTLFRDTETDEFPHTHRRTAETLVITIGTHSHTLVIPKEERDQLLQRTLTFLHTNPPTATGEFDLPLITYVERTIRT